MRIVSLLPSATEIACALGLRPHLVGISHECDFPASVADLPRLTSSILAHGLGPREIDAAVTAASLERRPLYAVDGERLAALQPDLILTQGVCAVCAVTADTVESSLELVRLESACTAPVLSLEATNFAGIQADILAVGAAAERTADAQALVESLRQRWRALAPPSASRPRVLMLEWPDPPWYAGHWVPEQVAAAGGERRGWDVQDRPRAPVSHA